MQNMNDYVANLRQQAQNSRAVEDLNEPTNRQAVIQYVRNNAHEREEIVGDAFALAFGSKRKGLHPFAHHVIENGLGYDNLRVMMGLSGLASGDMMGTLARGISLYAEDVNAAYLPEHDPLVSVQSLPDYKQAEIGAPVTFDAGELTEYQDSFNQDLPDIKAARGSIMQLRDHGTHFFVSRHVLINEDTQLIASWTREGVLAYYRAERAAIISALETNPNLSDGTAVFSADRSNLLTGATDLDAATLGAMMKALRELPTDEGNAGNYRAGILCVPADYELKALALLESMGLRNRVFLLADAGLTAFYLLPPKEDSAVVVLAALDGQRRPITDVVAPSAMFESHDPRANRDGLYMRVWGHHDAQLIKPTAIKQAL